MISTLVSKNREQLFLNGFPAFSVKKVQVQFRQIKSATPDPEQIRCLNSLVNAYLFREFNRLCTSDASEPVLQSLKSPGYRTHHVQRLPALLHRILRGQYGLTENCRLEQQIPLPAETRQLAVHLANHSPFIHHRIWFNRFEDLHQLHTDDFLALLCGTLIHQQCLDKHSPAEEIQLFFQGVCSGYINLQLARNNGHNPLHSFLAPLIHYVSLIVIHRELRQHGQLPNATQLLSDIDGISIKLGYWIARDWGLPDNISHILKERFMKVDQPSLASILMQKSEHAYLAIHLCQQGLLSRRQTQDFLHTMQLESYGFLESIGATH